MSKEKTNQDPKYPKWFIYWRDNEFKHLALDVRWIKWLMGFVLIAVIGGAIAVIVG